MTSGTRRRIRVGLIGADRRALWYAAILDRIEPLVFAELAPAFYHHFTFYSLVEPQHRRARGFRIEKVYDPDSAAAERLAAAFGGRPTVCADLEAVSDDVDLVFIANECGDGANHRALAEPGLEKGVPTFIDRPFASRVKDARAMVALARRRRAPLLACSHLALLPHARHFKSRYREIGPIDTGMVHGQGPNPARIADAVALALVLFGDDFGGRVSTVQSMGAWPLEIMHLRYVAARSERRREVVVVNSHTEAPRNAVHAQAISLRAPVCLDNVDDFLHPEGGLAVIEALKQMVRTGRQPVSCPELIELVAVMEAGRLSHNKPQPVEVGNLR